MDSDQRVALVQLLYCYDLMGDIDCDMFDPKDILSDLSLRKITNNADYIVCKSTVQALIQIKDGIYSNIYSIDDVIKECLTDNWSIHRLGKPVLAILRLGIWEINKSFNSSECTNFIGKSIHQYIELAKEFNHHQEVAFINGVLDRVIKDVSLRFIIANSNMRH